MNVRYRTPEDFGAVPDGNIRGSGTDNTQQLKDWIRYSKEHEQIIACSPGARYNVSDTLWFGSTNALAASPGVLWNGATIYSSVDKKPIIDLVGIANIDAFIFENGNFYSVNKSIQHSGIVMGRPRQSDGTVKSSGFARIEKNLIWGRFLAACYYNVQSEVNVLKHNNFANQIGASVVITKADIMENTQQVECKGSIPSEGTKIAWENGSGKILEVNQQTAWVKCDSGELFVGSIFNGVKVISTYGKIPQCWNSVGIEERSTSTELYLSENGFSSFSSKTSFPTIMIFDWSDVVLTRNDINCEPHTDKVWVSGDSEIATNAEKNKVGCYGIKFRDNYFHKSHRNSLRIGSKTDSAWQSYSHIEFNHLNAGSPTNSVYVVNSSSTSVSDDNKGKINLISPQFYVNGNIILNSAKVLGGGIFKLFDSSGTKSFLAKGITVDGELLCKSSSTVTVNKNRNFKVNYFDTNLKSDFSADGSFVLNNTTIPRIQRLQTKVLRGKGSGHITDFKTIIDGKNGENIDSIKTFIIYTTYGQNITIKHDTNKIICSTGIDIVMIEDLPYQIRRINNKWAVSIA